MKKLGFQSVILSSHKDYYPVRSWRIESPFEETGETFMVIELSEKFFER
ncbi:hypothetical protein J7E26_14740 [Bacillus sp. ISL-51]|nr:hypothetical protein [Bacillus sp. ISL-51]